MALPATDGFTGTGALSGSWTVAQGACSRAADDFFTSDAGENQAFWNADTFNANQYSQAVVQVTTGYPFLSVRLSGSGATTDGYTGISEGSFGGIYRVDNGVRTLLASFSRSNTVGELHRLEISGTGLTYKVDGSTIQTTTDNIYASGSAGLGGFSSAVYWDDWEGGNLGGGAGGAKAQSTLTLMGVQ